MSNWKKELIAFALLILFIAQFISIGFVLCLLFQKTPIMHGLLVMALNLIMAQLLAFYRGKFDE